MIKFLPQVLMVIFIITYCSIYLVSIKSGKSKPILATWLFLVIANLLSILTSYKETGINGITSNAFNIIDSFSTTTIFFVVLFNKNTRRRFNKFEKYCLLLTGIIFIGWLISGQNILAHLAVQFILVIAYFPTFVHLWKSSKNTESLSMWGINALASGLGTIQPLKTMALLPLVYGIRATVSTFTVFLLILRLKYKEKQ